MDSANDASVYLSDSLDDYLKELHQNETLLNDVIKTIQRRPNVFEGYHLAMGKISLKECDRAAKTAIEKSFNGSKNEEVNYKQLKYVNDKLNSTLSKVIIKTRHHERKNQDKYKSIAITDDSFQKEIEKIVNAKDEDEDFKKEEAIDGDPGSSYETILSKLASKEEEYLLEQDDNNFGEEIDLSLIYNRFCDLTSNFTITLGWFLEEFLVNKFGQPDYPLRNNDVLVNLNKSTVKLWNSGSYLAFLLDLIKEITKNVSAFQPLLPIEFLMNKQAIQHYNKLIRNRGIVIESTGCIICQYCKTSFENEEKFKHHKHPKVSRIKEDICLKEYQLHFLITLIEKRLQKTILNLKIFSKLSFIEKSKLPRFMAFDLYPASDRENDKRLDNLEKLDVDELADLDIKNKLISQPEDDVLHENRFIREKENDYDDDDDDEVPTWLVKLQKLDEKYQCEICGNIAYKGKTTFEAHFNGQRHVFGLQQLGYKGEDFEIFNGITKIKESKDLMEEL